MDKTVRFGAIVAAVTAPLAIFVANLDDRAIQAAIVGAFVVAVVATWLVLRRSAMKGDN